MSHSDKSYPTSMTSYIVSESDSSDDELNDSDLEVMLGVSLPTLRSKCKSKHLNSTVSDHSMLNYTHLNHNKSTIDWKNFQINNEETSPMSDDDANGNLNMLTSTPLTEPEHTMHAWKGITSLIEYRRSKNSYPIANVNLTN